MLSGLVMNNNNLKIWLENNSEIYHYYDHYWDVDYYVLYLPKNKFAFKIIEDDTSIDISIYENFDFNKKIEYVKIKNNKVNIIIDFMVFHLFKEQKYKNLILKFKIKKFINDN